MAIHFDRTNFSLRFNNPPNIVWKKRILQNYTLPKTYTPILIGDLGDDAIYPNPDQQTVANNEIIELVMLKDVYVSRRGSISDGTQFYYITPECQPRVAQPPLVSNLPPSVVVPIYDHVITIAHQFTGSYAHFTCDFLPILFVMPPDILNKSFVLFFGRKNFQFLESFGFRKEQLLPEPIPSPFSRATQFYMYDGLPMINLGPEFAFARHLYTVTPWGCDTFKPALLDNLRVTMVKRYNLTSKPFRYVIYNRKMKKRGIANFDEIYTAITEKFPKIPWERGKTTVGYDGKGGSIQYYHEIKFIFAVHGAALANSIFMQPGSVVCELMIQRWTPNFMFTSLETGKKYVIGRDQDIPHSVARTNIVSVDLVLKIIEGGLAVCEEPNMSVYS